MNSSHRPPPASRPTAPAPVANAATLDGPLNWRQVVGWMRHDGLLAEAEAAALVQRLAAGSSSLHPLVRLAGAQLRDARPGAHHGEALDLEALTRWLAQRLKLPYLRIDPLKVDVARVTEVMSAAYAEKRRVLPVQVGAGEITVATAEPFVLDWVTLSLHDALPIYRKSVV